MIANPPQTRIESPDELLRFIRQPRELKSLPRSFVHAIFGEKGSGKSATANYYSVRAFLAGRRVFYNPEHLLAFGSYIALLDIINLEEELNGAFIWLDEIQESLNRAFQAATGPQMILSFIRQVRKRGATLVLTSNSPDQLPRTLEGQIDFHYFCEYLERADPQTAIIKQSVIGVHGIDTQGKFGKGRPRSQRGGRVDTRKRFWFTISNPHRLMALYDTFAITDQLAIRNLTPQKIKAYRDAKAANASAEQIVDLIRTKVVPELLSSGANAISTADLAKHIAQSTTINGEPLVLSVEYLGRLCGAAGLISIARKGIRWWRLPPIDKLELWQRGLWLPPPK